ncbi:hypothetical protein ACHAXR_007492 [Thalassiosira sp. AJA248-18]
MANPNEMEGHGQYLTALVRQERDTAYRRHDYLSHDWQMGLWKGEVKEAMQTQSPRQSPSSVMIPSSSPCSINSIPEAPSEICVRWREKIIEWKYQVIDRFDLDREIVSVSTFYLDQYLSLHYVDEELFQLVAMASIYLAIKIHSPKKVAILSIASTGNGLITVKHIEAMELAIMKGLNWHLFPPTSNAFIENFFPLISRDCQMNGFNNMDHKVADSLELARFLSELSVCAYPFVSVKPSSIAIAAIWYSFEYFGLPESTRKAFQSLANGLSLDVYAPEVQACGKLLRRVYQLAVPNDLSVLG